MRAMGQPGHGELVEICGVSVWAGQDAPHAATLAAARSCIEDSGIDRAVLASTESALFVAQPAPHGGLAQLEPEAIFAELDLRGVAIALHDSVAVTLVR